MRVDRRRFLKQALWAGIGWAAQACTPARSVPPPFYWMPSPTPVPTATPTATVTPTATLAPTATPTETPTATVEPTATPEPAATPAPALDPEIARPIGKDYPLPPGFVPSALVPLVSYPSIQVQPGREGMVAHPAAASALDRLFEAARQEGITDLYVRSAYRSADAQAALWESAGGWSQARVAPPGTSEHQSGLAFDFSTSTSGDSPLRFGVTAAGLWLRVHAHRYGFVNTYARPGIDGIQAEAWHYRYAGAAISSRLVELGYLEPGSTVNPIAFYAGLLEGGQP